MSATTVQATDYVDWASLGKVAGVSLVFGVGIVVLFSVAVLGLSMARGRASDDDIAVNGRGAGSAIAALCFVMCAAAVGYGLYLIIPQFH
jgi:hypothetical protein